MRKLLADNRLVNLTGAGGAGKTRLAVESAGRSGADFAEGIHYVDLTPVTYPEVVPVAVARALGLPDQPGRSTMDTLGRFIGERQMLIVLDNCGPSHSARFQCHRKQFGHCRGDLSAPRRHAAGHRTRGGTGAGVVARRHPWQPARRCARRWIGPTRC